MKLFLALSIWQQVQGWIIVCNVQVTPVRRLSPMASITPDSVFRHRLEAEQQLNEVLRAEVSELTAKTTSLDL